MAKLPITVKQLLTLRNPHPLPAPSLTRLQNVFRSTFQDAQSRKAETGWLVLTTCTLLAANRPSTIGPLYRFVAGVDAQGSITDGKLPAAVNKVAIMREAALKSTVFVGVPRVILSLASLHEALHSTVKDNLRTASRRDATPENADATLARGRALWDSIYAPHHDKLHDKLGAYHPDFISFIIQAYGAVLAPLPGPTRTFSGESSKQDFDQGNISRAQGSVVGIACLRAEERVVPQLTSHVFGLLKARYTPGLSEEDYWLASDEGTEWVIRTIDEILDVLAEYSQENLQAKL